MCTRCEELEEEVAYYKSELGLALASDDLEAIRLAFGVTPGGARLLLFLHRAKGRTATPLQILDAIPPRYAIHDDRNPQIVAVQVCKVKRAVGPGIIANVWGRGFRLTPAGLDLIGIAIGETPRAVEATELRDLHERSSEDLRSWSAHIAGILAHRDGDGGLLTATTYRRIADRLTGQPRVAA